MDVAWDCVTVGGGAAGLSAALVLGRARRRPPAIPGLDELWGRSVFHCPFCHGWEVRDQPLAVLARGELAVHKALLLRGWSDDVVLLTDGPAELDAEDLARLAAVSIAIDERPVAELVAQNGELAEIGFTDGSRMARRGVLVAAPLHQRSVLAEQLGAVAGVFAAGDVSAELPSVAGAIAAGSQAAAAVVRSLLTHDHGLPSQQWREDVKV
jgi:thioredoxin reductase